MSATANKQQDIGEIRARIELQLEHERAQIALNARRARQTPPMPRSIGELMSIDGDLWFVQHAYQLILGRPADVPGLTAHVEALRSGRTTRENLVLGMSKSAEHAQLTHKIPGFDAHLARLRRRRTRAKLLKPFYGVRDFIRNMTHVHAFARGMQERARDQDNKIALLEQRLLDIQDFTGSLKAQFARHAQATPHAPHAPHAQAPGTGERPDHARPDDDHTEFLNGFFTELSERFRGTEVDILQRNRVYSGLLSDITEGHTDAPVLDIACGRGEMLHVINDVGLKSIGIDMNDDLIAYCRGKSLDVVKADALSFIQAQPDASLAAITTTHFVEHLEFDYLVSVLRESFRALRPGGGLIVETPNPMNLVVATMQFYMDPTHRNPLPQALMELLLGHIGFTVSPIDLSSRGIYTGVGTVDHPQLNHMLNCPQDYALVGIKPR